MNFSAPDDLRVVTRAELSELLTISIPVLERMARDGSGPRCIRLSAHRVGYRLSDVRAWMATNDEAAA